ncbi:MAG: HAD-IC family P-type ATPase [Flammeovirgaceae bacterium]|nr:HAD-IC family P-type ATPase [Flammeovirgaceae bacterium]
MNHHLLPISEVQEMLNTGKLGLNSVDARERIRTHGLNKLPDKKKLSVVALFFRQFKNPLIYILFAAFVISVLTSHWVDAIIVSVVIYVSSVIGFFQEYKAGQALERLNKLIRYDVKVLRDGTPVSISHEQIVPGDVILISSGDKVPADARIIEVSNFSTIEASLTGESLPLSKQVNPLPETTPLAERKNMIYAGTVAASGNARAIVTATGTNTELGNIATMVQSTEEEQTPLQVQLLVFGKWLGIILVVINVIIFAVGIFTGIPLLEMFMTAVAVVVSAVPEGLIPAMTVILTVGMNKLVKKNGLVRKLVAAETLGSVTVICADKTGTLTRGEMRTDSFIAYDAVLHGESVPASLHPDIKKLLEISVMCNAGFIQNKGGEVHASGNPTDRALLLAGHDFGIDRNSLLEQSPIIAEIPFGSEHKFMATLHASPEKQLLKIIYTKGAPERILSFSEFYFSNGSIFPMRQEDINKIKTAFQELTSKGLRVIGIGFKNVYEPYEHAFSPADMKDIVFAGLVAFRDPLRPEVVDAIQQCREAGIKPIMITGDHKQTAATIANELGMQVRAGEVIEGAELDLLSDDELSMRVSNIKVFARVEPKHKSKIVSAFQRNGEVVAMTGDGVNDSPALKKSNIGVAMGSGTDISKDVADLVLLDDNFNTIVEAVRRGRIIFDNIRKVLLFLLTDAFSTMIVVGGAVLLGLPLPLLPAQILWIKLAESSLPAMALAFDEIDEGLMKRKPRDKNEPLISNEMKKLILFYALVMDTLLFVIFYYFWKSTGNLEFARTVTFVALGMNTFFYIFAIRGFRVPVYKLNPFDNKYLLATLILGISLILIAVYIPFFNTLLHTVPLGLSEWIILISYAVLSIVVYEIGKRFTIAKSSQ